MLLKVDSPLSNIDLAVVTVDTPIYVNFKVCKYLKELKIPFVGGGYNHALMTVYDDVNSYQQQDLQWKSYSKNLISPSFGPTNFEIAGLISNKALQCLWGVKKGFDFGIVQTADSRILPRSYKIE